MTAYDLRGVWALGGGFLRNLGHVLLYWRRRLGANCLQPYADDVQNCEQMATGFERGWQQDRPWSPIPYLDGYGVF